MEIECCVEHNIYFIQILKNILYKETCLKAAQYAD